MRIRIIAEASKKREKFLKIWGLSLLLDDDILFDTFSSATILENNLKKFRVDPVKIKHIIISHEHWDHTGGLWWLLRYAPATTVYICRDFSHAFKEKLRTSHVRLVEVSDKICIRDNVFSAGQLKFTYKNLEMAEQSLVIKQADKISVITGCSHPGVLTILGKASLLFNCKLDLLLGGFHLVGKTPAELARQINGLAGDFQLQRIVPLHCTGNSAVHLIKKQFRDRYRKMSAGDALVL